MTIPHRITVCPYLPKTVLDRDGVERELLGVIVNQGEYRDWVLDAGEPPLRCPPLVLLTGDIVKEAAP